MKKNLLITTAISLYAACSLQAQPANDNCASASPLALGVNCTNGTTVAATLEVWENTPPTNQQCWLSVPDNTVWHTFTPAVTGTYTISLDNRIDADGSEPDTQLKLLSGTCGAFALVACSEDNGIANTLAAQVTATLTSGVTYYLQVALYGTAMAPYCINVFRNVAPVNDCVNNAIDITALVNSVSPANPFSCNHGYVYNPPGGIAADDPTRQDIVGDLNGCNGWTIMPTTNPDHRDVWFKFTVNASTPPSYIQLYPNNINYSVLWVMGLYSGTPSSTCPLGNITGLSYIDCSCGILVDIPPGNDKGGARDQSLCTTPVHPRLAINGLANGTYYIRVWNFGGGNSPEGFFNLCIESIAPRPNSVDTCSIANVGYLGPDFNTNVNTTYTNLSNAGAHGNACQTATNEPLLGATPAGQARDACTGPWITYVGTINNVMNNTMIHSFNINACPGCEPTATIQLNNISRDGTPGNVAQLQVMAPNNCTGSTQTIMNGVTFNSCIEMRVAANAPLANGQYYIVVDGQDGQLLNYDLGLTITYPCPPTPVCTPLPVEMLSFSGENIRGTNILKWITASETNNDYFLVERSTDGHEFAGIKKVSGAGTSNNEHQYIIADSESPSGVSYYRLKQVDYNGEFLYSNTVKLTNATTKPEILKVGVSENNLNVNYICSRQGLYTLQVTDMNSRLVYSDDIYINEGSNTIKLDAGKMSKGVYMLSLSSKGNEMLRTKFVK